MEGDNMAETIWVIEVNLDSVDLFEYRITTSDRMLKMNVARTFLKVNGLPAKGQESNWIVIGMAHSEKEANQKAERLKPMVISEREHALATGESLYLNL
jgi:hypothetical protein